MKIAVDARELVGRPTGVGRYLSELLTEWSGRPDVMRHDWRLYSPQPLAVPAPFTAHVRVLSGSGGTQWEQWTLARALRADRPDVLLAPAYSAPLAASCPVVLTIHDVSFAAHPEWFAYREGTRRRTLARLSARRATIVLTGSEFSRGEIVRHLGIAGSKIRVIRYGVRDQPPGGGARCPPQDPIVLFVGSIFKRRHVDILIEAFASHVVTAVPASRLEIVGEPRGYPRVNLARAVTLQPLAAQRRISIRSYVDDATLAALYASATVFVFPSEYEGFGLTPLEALAAGVPPIVLDTPVASEVYGPAARYVSRESPLAVHLGEAIAHMLTSASARADVLRQSAAVLARYRWDTTANQTFAVLEEAARV
jgi:glycosyltransferase involved in cell wall biosynthesis